MDKQLQKVCETYIFNRNEMRRILRSSGAPMHLMGAAVLTVFGLKPDEARILEAERLLQEREPEDSPIRGWIKSVTTVHMMLADSAEAYYDDLRRTHDLIHINRGGDDERYYMAAMMMSDKISNMQEILQLVDRTSVIHESMGKTFSSLEDKSSYVTAAFAAVNGIKNVRKYLDDIADCREQLASSGMFGETVPEELCMLLAIPPVETGITCAGAVRILEAIRAKGYGFASDEELAMLAFLAALDMTPEEVAVAVCDADEFLASNSGFSEGRGIILRHVYATVLVIMSYTEDKGCEPLRELIKKDKEILKRMVLMQSQSVMHIQMDYVDREELHI